MVTKALFLRLEAKPGREAGVESFLRGGRRVKIFAGNEGFDEILIVGKIG